MPKTTPWLIDKFHVLREERKKNLREITFENIEMKKDLENYCQMDLTLFQNELSSSRFSSCKNLPAELAS